MTQHKKNNILDDFSDISLEEKEKILWDFEKLQTSLKATTEYKENLFSQLQALYHFKEQKNYFSVQKYISWLLAFTFCVSGIWYFFSKIENDTWWEIWVTPVQTFSDISDVSQRSIASISWEEQELDSEVSTMMMKDIWVVSFTDKEKEIFENICQDIWGFFISEEYFCVLDMSDICSLDSLKYLQDNSCNIFFQKEIGAEEDIQEVSSP